MANNTALRAGKDTTRTITFKNKEHEKFYYTYLPKCRYQDVYHKALVYCLGIDRDTRENAEQIYDFKTGYVKTECLHEGWQTSGSVRIIRLAFNLYCDGKSAEKIKLTSYDDLFGSSEVTAEEKIVSVPIRLFHTFKDHPFRVLDDEKMQETVESVKRYGILMPGIVRPYGDGEYEMVAGHRRWRACELAGMEEMPVIIREMDDDTATVIMVDTNIQREDILPSEKAHAYKMKYEAMKHQGSKGEKHTADLVGEAAGESGRTVQRYIRLSFLISRLLDYVDNKRLSMKAGEKLSFLTVEEQEWVLEAIDNAVLTVTDKQAELFKNHSREKTLNQGIIYSVLLQKKEAETKVTLSAKKVRSYFPPAYTKEQVEEVIYTLLEQWRKKKGKEEQEDAGDTV